MKNEQLKNVNEMTRKEFEALPYRKDWSIPVECQSLVILPTRHLHDSGYRSMDFVACGIGGKPICRLSGCSDVLNFEGIGGYGYKWLEKYNTVPKGIPPVGWSVDCLKKSGLLRIFPGSGNTILCEAALSNFEIYSKAT